jgi:hypothetical protein
VALGGNKGKTTATTTTSVLLGHREKDVLVWRHLVSKYFYFKEMTFFSK